MQEAEAVALHSSLSAAAAQRGAGGLGFEGGKSKKEKKTKAEKELMTSKHSTGREFATTTASAVAAGHWDPWARPVEFKMKEVNRRVGGLYTMFVKGGVEGNTLKNAPVVTPPAASSSTAAADKAFNWKKAIKEALRAAPGGELKLKRLRQAVLSEHAKQTKAGDAESGDNAKAAFKKRLKKMDGVSVSGKLVKLAPKS